MGPDAPEPVAGGPDVTTTVSLIRSAQRRASRLFRKQQLHKFITIINNSAATSVLITDVLDTTPVAKASPAFNQSPWLRIGCLLGLCAVAFAFLAVHATHHAVAGSYTAYLLVTPVLHVRACAKGRESGTRCGRGRPGTASASWLRRQPTSAGYVRAPEATTHGIVNPPGRSGS